MLMKIAVLIVLSGTHVKGGFGRSAVRENFAYINHIFLVQSPIFHLSQTELVEESPMLK